MHDIVDTIDEPYFMVMMLFNLVFRSHNDQLLIVCVLEIKF